MTKPAVSSESAAGEGTGWSSQAARNCMTPALALSAYAALNVSRAARAAGSRDCRVSTEWTTTAGRNPSAAKAMTSGTRRVASRSVGEKP